jgi:hypothetical protein
LLIIYNNALENPLGKIVLLVWFYLAELITVALLDNVSVSLIIGSLFVLVLKSVFLHFEDRLGHQTFFKAKVTNNKDGRSYK